MQLSLKQPAAKANRLPTIRRLYVYLVTFVSLAAGLMGAAGLYGTLCDLWLGPRDSVIFTMGGAAQAVAGNAGLLLVATPIFLVHWWLAQRYRSAADERDSVLRKLYLYGATAVSLGFLLVSVYLLVESAAQVAFGLPLEDKQQVVAAWVAWLLTATTNAALILYWRRQLANDGDYGREAPAAAAVRRLFLTVAGLVGLCLSIWGSAALLRALLDYFVGLAVPDSISLWPASALGSAVAQLLVGGWLLYTIRCQWRDLIQANRAEGSAVLRRVFLYVTVVIGALATLAPAALVLRQLLLMIFGGAAQEIAGRLSDTIDPLSFVPAGALTWWWVWRVLRRELAAFGETRDAATVRRIYYYLVAATGLGLMWAGAAALLHALLDVWFSGDGMWTEPLANGLSLLAVGTPVWLLHWRAVQRVAQQTDAAGAAERAALIRRVYLFGVALVAMLIMLFQLAAVVYRLLLMWMGDPNSALFTTETATNLADALVATAVWVMQLLAIRRDAQLDRTAPPLPAQSAETGRREQLERYIAELEAELAAARQALAEIESQAG